MTRDQIIETMARAICLEHGDNPDMVGFDRHGRRETCKAFERWIPSAQASLQALEDAGLVVVPNMKRRSFSQNNAWVETVKAATVSSTTGGETIDPTWATLLALEQAVSTFLKEGDQEVLMSSRIGGETDAATPKSAATDEIADLKATVIAFCAPWATIYAREHGYPPGHLHPHHYDILERCGGRMVDFTRGNTSARK